jgi:hypothetical protein
MNCVATTGAATTKPAAPVCHPGAINSNDAMAKNHRSQRCIFVKKYAENAEDNNTSPIMHPTKVTTKSAHVKPFNTSNSEGENTNTNGTSSLLMPSLNAVLPV